MSTPVTPEYVFEHHTLNACVELGDICNCCLETWPCDAYILACWTEEQLAASAKLVADLVAQRDGLL